MTEPASTPEVAIGIGIGTSPCSVSVWNGSQVEVLKDTINEMIKRSCETFKEHDDDEATILKMKHLIDIIVSDPIVHNASTNFPFLVHALDIKPFHPFIAAFVNKVWRSTNSVELLGKFLVELRQMVETHLKRPVRYVVFTVPVSFSRLQLNRIHRACGMAGLNVFRVMPQPTAVALLYAKQQMQASASIHEDMVSESEKIALIFNMDAAYCDVAVIATSKGKCQIKGLVGSTIGEEDLLGNMMHHLLPDSENMFKKHVHDDKEIKSMAFLRVTIQEAIHQLSSLTSVEVDLNMGDGLKICKVVEREEFEKVNKEVFEKCERLMIQCLQDAKVEVENLNDVIIVGGCCNIPKVKSLVTKICKGKEVYKGMNPLEATLCGAAEAGAIALGNDNPFGDLEMLNFHFTPLAIGIQANGNNFIAVIPRNTSVPTTRRLVFTTIHDNQTAALIVVYEGEGQKAEENHLLGYFKITEIPEAPKGVPEINVCMEIDHKNRLTVITSVEMYGFQQSAIPVIEARMTKFDDDDHGWCGEGLIRSYGDTMDLVTLLRKEQ
ncbi:heat shock 70 kDa protein 8-like [Cicer arietinum]|uniref:Heat shock 70 kDa protein 8-like n=1 Tax=Cicer arietinum TaxID=3827 RepID=A0A1S2YQQ4_CICAR|nr:heat shock 70 kDa protein 8-like [Cicer arietinum]